MAMSTLQLEDFKMLKIIGRGGSAAVYAAELNNDMYVIKAVQKKKAKITKFGVTEKNILKNVNNPFIIKFFGSFTTTSHLCFVLEYAGGGDLLYHVEQNGWKLSARQVKFYGAEMILAINYLHSYGIIHRDIKLKNILIANDGHIKITDFGSAMEEYLGGQKRSFTGTLNCMAPEMFLNEEYSFPVDWWGLGVCLYIMLHGRFPINFLTAETKYERAIVISKTDIIFSDRIPEIAVSLLKGLLEKNPNNRLGENPEEIKSHLFFDDIDWERLEKKEISPPFKPKLKGIRDFRYFDQEDIQNPDSLTPDPDIVDSPHFKDFYYVNPDWKY